MKQVQAMMLRVWPSAREANLYEMLESCVHSYYDYVDTMHVSPGQGPFLKEMGSEDGKVPPRGLGNELLPFKRSTKGGGDHDVSDVTTAKPGELDDGVTAIDFSTTARLTTRKLPQIN